MNGRRAGTSGFTLVEVIIAAFALALGLAALLVSFSSLMRTVRLADSERKAMHLSRELIEELRTLPFSAPEFNPGTHAVPGGSYVVSPGPYLSTREIRFLYEVVAPNNSTSHVTMTTVMTSAFHP